MGVAAEEIRVGTLGWSVDPTVLRIAAAIAVVVLAIVASRALQAVATRRIDDAGRRYRLRKIISITTYVVAVVVFFEVLQISLGELTVAIGIAGAGIAFALQEVIASIAGWFAISLAGFYKPGDRVQLGGIKGDVVDIGLLRTTLMEIGEWVSADLYNGRIVRIANSFVFKEPVFNYSGDFPFLWDELMVPLKYGGDWRLAREVLHDVAQEVVGAFGTGASNAWRTDLRSYLVGDTSTDPVVTLKPTDNWIELRLRYVVDYRYRRGTQDRIFTRFLEEVDRSEGRIGFGSQTIQVIEGSRLAVRTLGDEARPPNTDSASSSRSVPGEPNS